MTDFKEQIDRESVRFKMKILFNHHLTLIQDLNGIRFSIGIDQVSYEDLNWELDIHILFWSIQFNWNGRSAKKNAHRELDKLRKNS